MWKKKDNLLSDIKLKKKMIPYRVSFFFPFKLMAWLLNLRSKPLHHMLSWLTIFFQMWLGWLYAFIVKLFYIPKYYAFKKQ